MAIDATLAARLADLILPSLHREYPNKIAHVMTSDADARPPRSLTPAFYGCFDWHSAVHSHWTIARLVRDQPDAPWSERARAALDRSLTPDTIAREVEYLSVPARVGFEMPYGIAWLLVLAAELREHDAPWSDAIFPLAAFARDRFATWLDRLPWPIRTGQHPQSAFAIGLSHEFAVETGDANLSKAIERRSVELYGADQNAPLAYEPSGHDFLSPCLAEADLLARVLPRDRFQTWFNSFLPRVDLSPVLPPDRSDAKLVHLDGLNLSRAWMLDRIASALDREDLRELAQLHRDAGLAAITGEHYESAHWLGTFALRAALAAQSDPG